MWPVLNSKLRRHYQYHGINDNRFTLAVFRERVRRMAKRHLSRQSQKSYVTLAVLGDDRRYEWLASLSFSALCDLIDADCVLGWHAVDAR